MGSVCVKPHTSVLAENINGRRKASEFTEALLSTTQSVTGDPSPSPGCFSKPRSNKKSETSRAERARRHLIAELIKREECYGHSLNQLEEHFMTPLCAMNSPILTHEQAMKMFSNLGALVAFSRLFLERLKSTRNVSEVFWEFVQYLQNFQFYVQQYHISLQTIDSLQGSQAFQEYLDTVRNEYQLELMALLLAPIEQFCTYARFLDLLSELTPPKHREFSKLQDVLHSYAEVTAELEEVKEAVVNMTTILAVQNRMKGDFDSFVRPDRVFLCDGLLDQLSDSSVRKFNSRIVFLFSNLLIWSTDTYKFKGSVDLSRKSIEVHRDPQTGEVLGVEVQLRSSKVVFLFRDAEQREIWLEAIGKTVARQQHVSSTPHTSPSLRPTGPHQVSPPPGPPHHVSPPGPHHQVSPPGPISTPVSRHSISHFSGSPSPHAHQQQRSHSRASSPHAHQQHSHSRTSSPHQQHSHSRTSSPHQRRSRGSPAAAGGNGAHHQRSYSVRVSPYSSHGGGSRVASPNDWSLTSDMHIDHDDELVQPSSKSPAPSRGRPAVAQDVSSVPIALHNSRRTSSLANSRQTNGATTGGSGPSTSSSRSHRSLRDQQEEIRRHSFHDGAHTHGVTIRQKLRQDRLEHTGSGHGQPYGGPLTKKSHSINGYVAHGSSNQKRNSAVPHYAVHNGIHEPRGRNYSAYY